MQTSLHYTADRESREAVIREIGEGVEIYAFPYDYNGTKQIHKITDTGIINVYNEDETVLITKLIARPAQITRYFKQAGRTAPKTLFVLACKHKDAGLNLI